MIWRLRCFSLGILTLVSLAGCTHAHDPEFSSSISTEANLNALGPAFKELQAQWTSSAAGSLANSDQGETRDSNPNAIRESGSRGARESELISWPLVELSFENAVVPFQRSSQRMALDLLLNTGDSLNELRFARGISPEYKSNAVAILELATQVGMETWGHTFFDSILQTRPSLERLSAYQKTLSAGLVFTAQEQRRASSSARSGDLNSISFHPDEARIALLTRALDESWTADQLEDLEIILGVARLEHPCGKLPTRSLMVQCLGASRFSNIAGGFFAPAFGRRYQELAKDLIGTVTAASPATQILGTAFFSPHNLVWSHCEADQFTIKRALLRGSFRALNKDHDEIDRTVMERQIHDLLRDCSSLASPRI